MPSENNDEQPRVMVDIETLGVDTGAVILSIGAVQFSTDGIEAEYHRSISMESCQEAGLHIDAATLEWWLERDGEVRDVLTGGDALDVVLSDFADWYPPGAEVWANSPAFDCEQLEAAFEAVDTGISPPWGYDDERDVRTLTALPCAVEVEKEGNDHDALADAKHQARIVAQTLAKLEGENTATHLESGA